VVNFTYFREKNRHDSQEFIQVDVCRGHRRRRFGRRCAQFTGAFSRWLGFKFIFLQRLLGMQQLFFQRLLGMQ